MSLCSVPGMICENKGHGRIADSFMATDPDNK